MPEESLDNRYIQRVHRSAVTGQFVTEAAAAENPRETVREEIWKPRKGRQANANS